MATMSIPQESTDKSKLRTNINAGNPLLDENGYAHIVIFSADGGIGQRGVARLADDIAKGPEGAINGGKVIVHLLARKNAKKIDPSNAFAREAIVAHALSPNSDLVETAFAPENHMAYDVNNLEALKPILEKASVVHIATGAPRKAGESRDAVTIDNIDATNAMFEATAKYTREGVPIITNTNQVDAIVMKGSKIVKDIVREYHPDYKTEIRVIGMGGDLDEARLKVFASRLVKKAVAHAKAHEMLASINENTGRNLKPQEKDGQDGYHAPVAFNLNSIVIDEAGNSVPLKQLISAEDYQKADDKRNERLLRAGVEDLSTVKPSAIDGRAYAEHGETIVVAPETITVHGMALSEYLKANLVEEEKAKQVASDIVTSVKSEGGKFNTEAGNSTQFSPAVYAVKLIEAALSDTPSVHTVSVSHTDEHDGSSEPIASGRPVRLSNRGVEILDYPPPAKVSDEARTQNEASAKQTETGIAKSRAKIARWVATYDAAKANEPAFTELAATVKSLTSEKNEEGKITALVINLKDQDVGTIAQKVATTLNISPDAIEQVDMTGVKQLKIKSEAVDKSPIEMKFLSRAVERQNAAVIGR